MGLLLRGGRGGGWGWVGWGDEILQPASCVVLLPLPAVKVLFGRELREIA